MGKNTGKTAAPDIATRLTHVFENVTECPRKLASAVWLPHQRTSQATLTIIPAWSAREARRIDEAASAGVERREINIRAWPSGPSVSKLRAMNFEMLRGFSENQRSR